MDRETANAIFALSKRMSELEKTIDLKNVYAVGRLGETRTSISDGEDATCELSEDVESRLADIEDALCEISES